MHPRKCSSLTGLYKLQKYSPSIGTQCEFSTVSRGVQCTPGNSSKSCGTQYEVMQYTSCGTQWSSEDVRDESTLVQDSPYREKASTSPLVLSVHATESKTLGKNIASCVLQHHELRMPGRKKIYGKQSSSVKSIKKQQKDDCVSSSALGIAETPGIESPVSIEQPTKIMRKKKRLWTPSHDVISVCDDSEANFSHLFSKVKNIVNPHKGNRNNVYSRIRYTYEEERDIIAYISKNKLYSRVGGVSMWQDMEEKGGIDRTWQSLKEHFRKKILPNIEKFELSSEEEELFSKIAMR